MRRILAIAGLALLSGCCNMVERPEKPMWACSPYGNTVEVAKTLAAPFVKPTGPEGAIAQAYATLLFPIILLDLPFDVVVDTVFLPWDFGWWLAR